MKKLAPILIVILVCIFMISYLFGMIAIAFAVKNIWVSILLGIVALCILGGIVGIIVTLLARLKEIDKEVEEKDDLSKY